MAGTGFGSFIAPRGTFEMITCQMESLPMDADRDLRQWLNRSARQTLVRLADSKVKLAQTEALTAAVEAKDYPFKSEAAEAKMREAQRYQTFIDVLEEFSQTKGTFYVAKLT
jgi:hypothetical protein